MEEDLEFFLLPSNTISPEDIDPHRTCRNTANLAGIQGTASGREDHVPWDPHRAGFFPGFPVLFLNLPDDDRVQAGKIGYTGEKGISLVKESCGFLNILDIA
jgi:hypothetical protein